MNIRTMSLSELETVLGWAKDEGWNPGVSDASAFFAADPGGFFLADVDGTPAASISVVNHDDHHAFLGLYICKPKFRGQGIGFALWNAALNHAGTRAVTLEGVVEQQSNYARSGFKLLGKTVRYSGKVTGELAGADLASPGDMPWLLRADQTSAGHTRNSYSEAWFANTDSRKTVALYDAGNPVAFATFRTCIEGTKIGPFHAETESQACHLLASNPFSSSGNLYIDVPATSPALTTLITSLGFEPIFETAKMVRGEPAKPNPPEYHALTTLELG